MNMLFERPNVKQEKGKNIHVEEVFNDFVSQVS